MHHWCQRHRWDICHRCHWHRLQNCRWYQWHRRQICHCINETGGKFCHQFRLCCWRRWQIMGTVSCCRHLKVNLKAKIYIYVNSSTHRFQNKIIKIFLMEDFFHLPPVSMTPVVHVELWISPRIFEKIWNGTNGILRGLGETDWWKKPEVEILVALSLEVTFPSYQSYSTEWGIKRNLVSNNSPNLLA